MDFLLGAIHVVTCFGQLRVQRLVQVQMFDLEDRVREVDILNCHRVVVGETQPAQVGALGAYRDAQTPGDVFVGLDA